MFDIFDKLVNISGLYERVFWKLLDDLIYHQWVEARKNILKNVFWFKDVTVVFKKEIERWNFHELTKMLFKYRETEEANNKTLKNNIE